MHHEDFNANTALSDPLNALRREEPDCSRFSFLKKLKRFFKRNSASSCSPPEEGMATATSNIHHSEPQRQDTHGSVLAHADVNQEIQNKDSIKRADTTIVKTYSPRSSITLLTVRVHVHVPGRYRHKLPDRVRVVVKERGALFFPFQRKLVSIPLLKTRWRSVEGKTWCNEQALMLPLQMGKLLKKDEKQRLALQLYCLRGRVVQHKARGGFACLMREARGGELLLALNYLGCPGHQQEACPATRGEGRDGTPCSTPPASQESVVPSATTADTLHHSGCPRHQQEACPATRGEGRDGTPCSTPPASQEPVVGPATTADTLHHSGCPRHQQEVCPAPRGGSHDERPSPHVCSTPPAFPAPAVLSASMGDTYHPLGCPRQKLPAYPVQRRDIQDEVLHVCSIQPSVSPATTANTLHQPDCSRHQQAASPAPSGDSREVPHVCRTPVSATTANTLYHPECPHLHRPAFPAPDVDGYDEMFHVCITPFAPPQTYPLPRGESVHAVVQSETQVFSGDSTIHREQSVMEPESTVLGETTVSVPEAKVLEDDPTFLPIKPEATGHKTLAKVAAKESDSLPDPVVMLLEAGNAVLQVGSNVKVAENQSYKSRLAALEAEMTYLEHELDRVEAQQWTTATQEAEADLTSTVDEDDLEALIEQDLSDLEAYIMTYL